MASCSSEDTQADALGLLALVAGQDLEPGDEDGSWRIAQRVAPDRVISMVDPQSRHMHKSQSVYRDGYKAHIAVEPEPRLQVPADSAYGSGQVRSAIDAAGHTAAIKAIPMHRNAKLGADQLNRDDFLVHHTAATVACPGGQHGLATRAAAINLRRLVNLGHEPTEQGWTPN